MLLVAIYHIHMNDLWDDIKRWLNICPVDPVRSSLLSNDCDGFWTNCVLCFGTDLGGYV